MSERPSYIGDEVMAAGYRLAGALTLMPRAGEEMLALTQAMKESPLVLVSVAVAQRLNQATLRDVMAGLSPLVVIVPDLGEASSLPDAGERLRAEIGLKT